MSLFLELLLIISDYCDFPFYWIGFFKSFGFLSLVVCLLLVVGCRVVVVVFRCVVVRCPLSVVLRSVFVSKIGSGGFKSRAKSLFLETKRLYKFGFEMESKSVLETQRLKQVGV